MEDWSLFPSDTAAYFPALDFGIGYALRRHFEVLSTDTAVWICLPRMFLGAHYLSDIVAGSLLGILTVFGLLRLQLLRRFSARLFENL
jgi:undecaprenyl-diphosphatase